MKPGKENSIKPERLRMGNEKRGAGSGEAKRNQDNTETKTTVTIIDV